MVFSLQFARGIRIRSRKIHSILVLHRKTLFSTTETTPSPLATSPATSINPSCYKTCLSKTVYRSFTMSSSPTKEQEETPTTGLNPGLTADSNNDKNHKRKQSDEENFNSESEAKRKKKFGKNHTRRNPKDYDVNLSQRDRKPHEGSFANPALREQFGIVDLNPPSEEDLKQKRVKRKVALFLGFVGTKYGGFQMNAGQRTLQAEIELALYRAGMINEQNFGNTNKYSWSSSARTDKGVHACAQVCSLKVELLENEINDMELVRTRLQELLPDEIRVLDVVRVTQKFCAKTQRDKVRYSYMLPSFVLQSTWRSIFTEHGIPLTGRQDVAKKPLSDEEVQKLQSSLKEYRSTSEQRELLQKALNEYVGTHPFHNFTKGLKPGEASANRYIISFDVQEPVVVDGVEWIPTQVVGQSFLLHQIRKMISMAIDVARETASVKVLKKALSKHESIRVGLAPAQGLFLEMSFFDGYNRRKNQQQNELPDIDWSGPSCPGRERWEDCRNMIRKHIVDEEDRQGNFVQYMYLQECIFDHRKFFGSAADED